MATTGAYHPKHRYERTIVKANKEHTPTAYYEEGYTLHSRGEAVHIPSGLDVAQHIQPVPLMKKGKAQNATHHLPGDGECVEEGEETLAAVLNPPLPQRLMYAPMLGRVVSGEAGPWGTTSQQATLSMTSQLAADAGPAPLNIYTPGGKKMGMETLDRYSAHRPDTKPAPAHRLDFSYYIP